MKRLLLVTYSWPPRAGVGLTRAWKWATFLPQHGWEVVILTPEGAPSQIQCDPDLGKLPGVEVLAVPYRTWRPSRPAHPATTGTAVPADRPRHGWRQVVSELLDTPDNLWPWASPAVAAARERLAKGDVHAILTTSPPETVHLIGRRLQREFGLPWVADLRDLWSCDHFRQRPGWKLALLRRLERHLLNRAGGLLDGVEAVLDHPLLSRSRLQQLPLGLQKAR